jgi:hypothetical protein
MPSFADAKSRSSSSRSSGSSFKSSSSSFKRSTSVRKSTTKKTVSLKKKPTINPKKKTVSLKKKPVTFKKPTTTKTTTIKFKSRPKTTSHSYKGHHLYYYNSRYVYFGDDNDCDYDDFLEGDDDCQPYYANNYQPQVKSAHTTFNWWLRDLIGGIVIFVILAVLIIILRGRMKW